MSQTTTIDTTQRSDVGAGTPQRLTTQARVSLVTGTATRVRINARDHAFTIDEPHDLGGTDSGANPVEHLLAALGACQVITYQVWAEKLGITVDGIDVNLTGEIDLGGFFGTAEEMRPGFDGITVQPHSRPRDRRALPGARRHRRTALPGARQPAEHRAVRGEVSIA